MKKILLAALAGTLLLGACRKTRDDVASQIETVSYPTISFGGGQYYSINVGGNLPTVSATAYDSVIGESYDVEISGTEALDNTTPGLYVINASATNKFGYITNEAVYVAVTNVNPATNLGGAWLRVANSAPVRITELANGLYETNDVGGAPTLQVRALFVHLNDTAVDVPLQITSNGSLECTNERLRMQPGDTTLAWVVVNPSFGTAVRTFKKQ